MSAKKKTNNDHTDTTKETSKITLSNTELVLIGALRYAFGRKTSYPSMVMKEIRNNWDNISENKKEIIIRDVSQYLETERSRDSLACGLKIGLIFTYGC